MKGLSWIAIRVGLIATFVGSAHAVPVTLTPPETLTLDGVNVVQGIFTLQSATSIDFAQTIATNTLVEDQLIAAPVVINPAVIGSGTEHFLFDAPDDYLRLNIFTFSFEVVNPTPDPNVFGMVSGVIFSATPGFNISLPTTTGTINPLVPPPILFEYIDIDGDSRVTNNPPDDINTMPDLNASLNLDIFKDGSLYFIFNDPLDTPFAFQTHGSVSGFTPAPIPLPGAVWLMGSALALGAARRRKAVSVA